MERLETAFFKFTVADGTFILLSASGPLMPVFFFFYFINKFVIFHYSLYQLIYLLNDYYVLLCGKPSDGPLAILVCTEMDLDICD